MRRIDFFGRPLGAVGTDVARDLTAAHRESDARRTRATLCAVRLELTRDSVAMGDDADAPHSQTLDLADNVSLSDAVAAVLALPYLAHIRGGKATWLVVVGRATKAVVAQQWATPRWLTDPRAPAPAAIHFRYLQQRDPDEVYTEMDAAGRRA